MMLLAIENRFDRRVVSSLSALAFASVVLLCGLTPWLWSVPVLMTFGGVAMSFSNTQANSYLQLEAGERRGQAASLFMLSMRGGLSIGALITGTVASNFNIHTALIANGAIALVLHFFVGRSWRNATT